MKHDLLIIGGGAAGIVAAITARELGLDVAILEGNDRIGKKILSTGNGRCNITNINTSLETYHCEQPNFYEPVLSAFDSNATQDFFMSLGLPLMCLDEGKMYPMSLQASSVIDIFRLTLEEKNIPVYLNTKIKKINLIKSCFELYANSEQIFECNKLILATGGISAPKTGSDGSGYTLAKHLGHKIITPLPALVQLKLSYTNIKALAGVKFDGSVSIYSDSKKIREENGEILFTDYGISGPPILQLSRIASKSLESKKCVTIKLDLLPNISKENLLDFFENHWATFSFRSLNDSFIGILNKKLIPILLKEGGISSIHKPCSDLEWKEKLAILKLLKEWEFQVTGTNSFSDSQVTAGGIDTKEINPNTLESKIVPNLYFAGEIIDVDADCGGFNLQWAWSSGYIAAKNSVEY